jgi:hypothetical protein
MDTDTIENRLRHNSPRVAGLLVVIAVACEGVRRLLLIAPDHIVLRVAGALAAGVRNWCGVMAVFVGVLWVTAVAAESLNRRFPGVARRTSTVVLLAIVLVVVAACFFFVPFCLGSLKEGTYDCITLARRVRLAFAGG